MNELVYSIAFEKIAEAQTKEAWGGTYYHGSSRAGEDAILREGLRPQASTGATSFVDTTKNVMNRVAPGAKGMATAEGLARKAYDPGRVYMSRSKNLARVYGIMGEPKRRAAAMRAIREGGIMGGVRNFLNYQPLQIAGEGLQLSRDPGHALLAVQGERGAVVPAERISRSVGRSGGLRNMLRRVILRR